MELFESRRHRVLRNLMVLFPILFLVLTGSIFFAGISHASRDSLKKEQQALEQTLKNDAIRTYALTGQYPQSLECLLEDYHITYDTSRFVIDYIPQGSNLLPSISVIPLTETFAAGKEARS